MIRRTTRHIFELMAALIAALTIALAIGAWLVLSGPVSLSVVKPALSDALAGALRADRVDFDEATIQWAREGRSLRLDVYQAEIIDEGGLTIEVPRVQVLVKAVGLLRGLLAPSHIAFTGASALIVRDQDGRMAFGLAGDPVSGQPQAAVLPLPGNSENTGETAPAPGEAEGARAEDAHAEDRGVEDGGAALTGRLIRALASPPDRGSALGYLRQVEIRDASIRFQDLRSGLQLETTGADLALTRAPVRGPDGVATGQRLTLFLSAPVDLDGPEGQAPVPLVLEGAHEPDSGRTDLTLSLGEADLKALRPLIPALEAYEALTLPVRAELGLTLGPDGAVERIAGDLLAGPGHYDLPEVTFLPLVEKAFMAPMLAKVPDRIILRALAVSTEFRPEDSVIDLKRIRLQTDTSDLRFQGRIALERAVDGAGRWDIAHPGSVGRAVQGARWSIGALQFDLEGEDLDLFVPVYSSKKARIERLALQGRHDLTRGDTEIGLVRLEIGGGVVELSGRHRTAAAGPDIALQGLVRAFPSDEVLSLWPQGTLKGPRDWIDSNIRAGTITTGTFRFDAPPGTFDVGYIPNEALRFAFTVEDLVTGVIPGLPDMTVKRGEALLLGDRFEARTIDAHIGRVRVREGSMVADTLHIKGSKGNFTMVADGPVPDLLQLIDMGPFGYPSRYGLNPAAAGGDGGLRLQVSMPMIRALTLPQIEFSVAANIRNLSMAGVVPGLDVSGGDVSLRINGAGLEGTGDLLLNGLPASFQWSEDFSESREHRTQFGLDATIDEDVRARLGLDLQGALNGPVRFSTRAFGEGRSIERLMVSADLSQADLNIPGTGWRKGAGDDARADLRVGFGPEDAAGNRTILVEDLRLAGEGLDITGMLSVGTDGRLMRADFPRLQVAGLADLAFKADRTPDGVAISLQGRHLNLGPGLELLLDMSPDMGADGGREGNGSGNGASNGTGSGTRSAGVASLVDGGQEEKGRLMFTSQIDRVMLLNDVRLDDAFIRLGLRGMRIDDLVLRSGIAGGGTVHVGINQERETDRTLIATTTDAGLLARGILDLDSLAGGRLNLNALLTDEVEGPISMAGKLTVEDFRVVNAPLFARVLTVGSLTGLSDLLQGEGIRFQSLELPFESTGGRWILHDGRAFGPSIGLTVDGGLDEDLNAADLRGTIVPAYAVNSALGRVPVIGDLFVNRDGEGLFAINYRIVGDGEGADIYVNPLSALTPGFLRRIFQLGDDGPNGP